MSVTQPKNKSMITVDTKNAQLGSSVPRVVSPVERADEAYQNIARTLKLNEKLRKLGVVPTAFTIRKVAR